MKKASSLSAYYRNGVIILFSAILVSSCGKNDAEQNYTPPPPVTSSDKETELKEKEEFLKLKEEELRRQQELGQVHPDSTITATDLSRQVSEITKSQDTAKITEVKNTTSTTIKKPEIKKKMVEKEKDLNKRLDNPKVAVKDYLEYIKRGISEGGDFNDNMKKASEVWMSSSPTKFKSNYKNTKKFTVVTEPEVVKQEGNSAVVKVKVKQTNEKNSDQEMTVTYNLIADKNGKWKIKNNSVKKN